MLENHQRTTAASFVHKKQPKLWGKGQFLSSFYLLEQQFVFFSFSEQFCSTLVLHCHPWIIFILCCLHSQQCSTALFFYFHWSKLENGVCRTKLIGGNLLLLWRHQVTRLWLIPGDIKSFFFKTVIKYSHKRGTITGLYDKSKLPEWEFFGQNCFWCKYEYVHVWEHAKLHTTCERHGGHSGKTHYRTGE